MILLCTCFEAVYAQSCGEWLELTSTPGIAYFTGINIGGSTKLTVEAKFISKKPFPVGQADNLVSKFDVETSTLNFNFLLQTTGAEITTENGYFKTAEVCDIIENKVYHVALVYDGDFLKFYRNGFLLSQVAATGNLTPNLAATQIGQNDRISANQFIGYIDEVRVWNVARPQDLIKTYMNQTLPTPAEQAGLVAYFTFKDRRNAQGDNINDLTLFPGAELNVVPDHCLFTADSCSTYIPPPDSIVISDNVTMCEGSHHQIKTYPADSYTWTPAIYLDDPTSPLPTATPPGSITYYVEAYIAATNTIIHDSVRITVSAKPVVSAYKSNDINCGSPTTQLEARGAETYSWSPAAVVNNANLSRPVVSVDTTTIFNVIGYNSAGCSSTASITVKVDKGDIPKFELPNAFTPNGDGKNDCFGIQRWANMTIEQFIIYNRWGQRIFQTKNPTECWDGRLGGVLQAPGGYIFIINASTFCGPIKRSGVITLIR